MKLNVGEKSYELLDWREEYRTLSEGEEEKRLNLTIEGEEYGLTDTKVADLKSGLEKEEEKIIKDEESKVLFNDGKRYKKIDRMTNQYSEMYEKNTIFIIMKK